MNSIQILDADFTKVLTPGSIKAAMKEAGAGSRDAWQVAPTSLKVIDGFNVRVNTDKLRAHIRSLADSMKSEGFYQHMPLSGYVAMEDGAQVIYITAGHNRLAAVLLANSEGAEIVKVPVIVSMAGVSMEDLIVELVRGNSAAPLTVYETAIVCKRLARAGWENSEIAKRLGFSEQHVINLLSLMSSHIDIRVLVANEQISASMAIDMIAKHGDKALQLILDAVDNAAAGGKKRVTKRFVEGAAHQTLIKKSAASMYATLAEVQADPAFSSLSDDTRAKLADLLAQIDAAKPTTVTVVDIDPRQNALFSEITVA
jgi:ParB family chromosome partitioning protein